MQVIHYPHPTLRHHSKPIKKVDADLKQIVAKMFELMYQHEGVGLAANQVDLPYRLFVANHQGDPAAKDAEFVFINPVISAGKGQAEEDEGCLSIPGVYAPVTRNLSIRVQAYNLAGEEIDMEIEGLFARIVQHETDHLDGVLFIDRLAPGKLSDIKSNLAEFELEYQSKIETGEAPTEQQVAARLAELEQLRT